MKKIPEDEYKDQYWDRVPYHWIVLGAAAVFLLLWMAKGHDQVVLEACKHIKDCHAR